MAAIDETVSLVLNQAFAKSQALGLGAADRLQGMLDNVSEQTKLGYLEGKAQVGTREAQAMQRMDTDKLAAQILQQRSASGQPQAAPLPQQVPIYVTNPQASGS